MLSGIIIDILILKTCSHSRYHERMLWYYFNNASVNVKQNNSASDMVPQLQTNNNPV